jgi:nucleoporin NUP159
MGTYGGTLLVYSSGNFAEPMWAIPRPNDQQLSGTSIIHTNWLVGSTWHIVYAIPRNPDSLEDYQPEEHHYVIMAAPDQRSCLDSKVDCPYDLYGLPREPGGHGVILRGWTNIEYLLLASDAHATDVGALVALPPATGQPFGDVFKIDMTESSMTIPLDAEAGETTILGMDLDLTATQPLHSSIQAIGDDPELPPMPILFFYNNDGVVSAYHIINEAGPKYPRMRSPDISVAPSNAVPPLSTFMSSTPTQPPPSQPSAFTMASTAPTSFAAFAQNKAPTTFGATATAFGNSAPTPCRCS